MIEKLDDAFRARFWAKVDRSGGDDSCWRWTASGQVRPGRDYGLVKTPGRKTDGAHRVAYILSAGEDIPPGMFVCHHCDNPRCCNPRHLFVGTHQDNVDDKVSKGRQSRGERHSAIRLQVAARGASHGSKTHPERWAKGCDCTSSAFSRDQVIAIRREYSHGQTTMQRIAERFGVTKGTIHRMVRGLTYADVPMYNPPNDYQTATGRQ